MDIDIVIPWVDGDDPDWIAQYNLFSSVTKSTDDHRAIRYKEYGLLKYWFRGIEKNAPWIRKIHFVTNGQKPSWLNTKHPQLHWVKHEDYIPIKYLPVFSSHPIEINMHNIEGLSDHFIYFNDDTYLIDKVGPNFFFSKKGIPLDSLVQNIIAYADITHIRINNLQLINANYSKIELIRKHFLKWFNVKYGLDLYRNIIFLPWKQIPGFIDYHLPQPFLKSAFIKGWELFDWEFKKTSASKFRAITDVNQYLFRYIQLCDGAFKSVNSKSRGKYFDLSKDNDKLLKFIISKKRPMICINDKTCANSEIIYKRICSSFEKILPDKSEYEL